ncbi:hypothetical protein L6164_003568 [Bauhinia variegata]|uniref:Uncharacterized protein n=1 Tax=Bauhinia variegata TaxID=167791 RepID=A0ACB9Q3X4_BAUVA|nr:hypothetical protein L6164_003568 [Bauhinia variegata]
MREKDDGLGLGLGLSLSFGSSPLKDNLIMQKPPQSVSNQKSSWNDLFQLPDRNSDARSFLRGIDVNLAPSTTVVVDCDDNNGVTLLNSTVSSFSGKRSEREGNGDEHEAERDSCSRGSEDEEGGGDNSRKKLRLSRHQAMILEETFKEHSTLNPKQKQALAKQLNLRARQVEVWFQNRRARTKLKQTEVDCEYLKRCCENLTEENRRLQKEVQEIRALKLSPQLYMSMNPPTTLTMCPSCERVAVSSTTSSSSATPPAPPNHNPNIQRPVPVNPWAAMSIQHRAFDGPARDCSLLVRAIW